MEAFEIHLEITTKNGKLKYIRNAFAPTGWEAIQKCMGYVYHNEFEVESVKFLSWKVLNPFRVYFPKEYFANQKEKI